MLVLICGHGGRDARCGVIAPVLKGDFERVLGMLGIEVRDGPVEVQGPGEEGQEQGTDMVGGAARVGSISHIGGHKFAGNVILYIPPGYKTEDGKESKLAGCGVCYGRVEPRHVEGIVRETVLGGRVIEELFRGGIRQGGEMLML